MATVTRTQVTTVDQVTAVAHNITGVTVPAGKLAVVRFGYQSDSVTISSVTDNAGNTWSVAVNVHSGSGDTQTSAIAFLVVPAGGLSGATVTITLSATATLAGHVAYFDSDVGWPSQATVLDKTSGFNTGLVTAWTSNATATTTQADELLVGVAYSGGAINGGTSTPGSGWTEENEQALTNSGYELVTEWQHVTSTGAYAATGTWSAAEIAACCIATFKTGAASAGPSARRDFTRGAFPFVMRQGRPIGIDTTARRSFDFDADRGPAPYGGFERFIFPRLHPSFDAGGITYQETGSLLAGATLSGADEFNSAETGSLLAGALQSGADAFTGNRAGSLIAGAIISGSDSFNPSETGSVLSNGILSGADVFQHAETGSLLGGGILSGADIFQPSETGSLLAGGILAGADSFTSVETGRLLAGSFVSAADVFTAAETGSVLAGSIISGVSSIGGAIIKTGSLLAGSVLSGPDATTHVETGSLLAASYIAGGDAHTAVKLGSVLAGGITAGGDARTAVKAGSLLGSSYLAGSSSKTTEGVTVVRFGPPSPSGGVGEGTPGGGRGQGTPSGSMYGKPKPGQVRT